MFVCARACVCVCVCVCVSVCACVRACVRERLYALSVVSMDKMFRFTNTVFIINYLNPHIRKMINSKVLPKHLRTVNKQLVQGGCFSPAGSLVYW